MKILNKIVLGLLRFLPCAFDATGMNRIQAGSKTLWLYESADATATIVGSGYFDTYTDYLRQGDCILISGGVGGSVDRDSAVVSSADNAATVTVAVKV